MNCSLLLAASGQGPHNLSIFDPVSPPAHSIRTLSILVLAITGLIFVIVEGILFYSILRFRRKSGDSTATEPPQVYGSKPIEIAWTAAPALVVFILVLVTTRTLWEVNVTPPEPAANDNTLFVTVVGRQWWWEYQYTHYNGKELALVRANNTRVPFITANELHIPASTDGTDRRVYLTLKSADVCHSFWVPRLAGKTDLIPGRTNYLWFQTDRADKWFLGQCAEYCGTQHANMLLRVRVHSPLDFDAWLAREQADAARPVEDAPQQIRDGRKLFLGQSCINCHAIRGETDRIPGHKRGAYGPDLTHLMSRTTFAGGMIENDPKGEKLREWVQNPQKIKPGCLMPGFGLNDRELDLIVAYLKTLR